MILEDQIVVSLFLWWFICQNKLFPWEINRTPPANCSLTLPNALVVFIQNFFFLFLSRQCEFCASLLTDVKCQVTSSRRVKCVRLTDSVLAFPSSIVLSRVRVTMQQACGVKITTRPQLYTVRPPCSLLAIMRGFACASPSQTPSAQHRTT